MNKSTTTSKKTDSHTNATPYLCAKDAAKAIQFYEKAFGAVEVMRLTEPGGKIAHATLKIGEALIMLADESPQFRVSPQTLGGSPVMIHLYVDDVDATASKAVAAGAKLAIPVRDQFYGDRSGRLVDPFGHIWIIASHKEDVSIEEMQKRFAALCEKK